MIKPFHRAAAAVIVLAAAPLPSWACATCGCTVNSDAAMGFSAATGWRLSLETTYIGQTELRSGTSGASAAEVVNDPSNPSLGGGEIEKETINRYTTLGLSYRPSADWNINLLLPYVSRDHTTYGQQEQPYTPSESAPDQISAARVSSLGDAKLIISYQGVLPTHNLGLQLGVKLPTGQYGTAVNFYNGPGAGTPLDASLNAGTGSTDVILGTYYYQPISQNFDAFVNAQFQAVVAEKMNKPGNDYRPGNTATLSFGLRYEANPQWIPQVQVNVSHKSADQGALADTTDTAGTVVYVSPGLTAQVTPRLHAYAVLQLPVFSNLSGYQLFPHWTATAGLGLAL